MEKRIIGNEDHVNLIYIKKIHDYRLNIEIYLEGIGIIDTFALCFSWY